jgi:hypothetical protein
MQVFCRRSGIVLSYCLSCMAVIFPLLTAPSAYAQASPGGGQVTIPESSIEKPGDSGVRAHTNIEVFRPNRGAAGGQASPGGVGPGGGNPHNIPLPNEGTSSAHPQ